MISLTTVHTYDDEKDCPVRKEVQLGRSVIQSQVVTPTSIASTDEIVYKVSTEVLPVVLTDPNTSENIKKFYEPMREWASVGEIGGREWAYVGTDEGGNDRDQLGPRLMNIMGTGHELAVLLRCTNKIAWNYGGDLLAFLHGFTSPGGQRLLELGTDLKNEIIFARSLP